MKSQFPLAPDPAEPPAKATREQLAARNAELETELAQVRAEREQAAKDETVIKGKMEVGLTREQAKAVIQRQREHGAARQTAYDQRRSTEVATRQK